LVPASESGDDFVGVGVDPRHFAGVIGFGSKATADMAAVAETVSAPALLRPLLELEAADAALVNRDLAPGMVDAQPVAGNHDAHTFSPISRHGTE
jgi:hypothetical protein